MTQVWKVTREAIATKRSIKLATKEEKGSHPPQREAEPLVSLLKMLKKL